MRAPSAPRPERDGAADLAPRPGHERHPPVEAEGVERVELGHGVSPAIGPAA